MPSPSSSSLIRTAPTLPLGLFYIPEFITEAHEAALLEQLKSSSKWNGVTAAPGSRRVLHFGYEYPYTGKKTLVPTTPIPCALTLDDIVGKVYGELDKEAKRTDKAFCDGNSVLGADTLALCAKELHGAIGKIDQLIVNEYRPGQGISAHIDDMRLFGSPILCLSIGGPGSAVVVDFTRTGHAPYSLHVQPRSLYIMSGEARSLWKHSIASRKQDHVPGQRTPHARTATRYSLTYRSAASVATTSGNNKVVAVTKKRLNAATSPEEKEKDESEGTTSQHHDIDSDSPSTNRTKRCRDV